MGFRTGTNPTTTTPIKTSQKNRFRILLNFHDYSKSPIYLKDGNLAGAEGRGQPPNSDRGSKISVLPCRHHFQENLKFGHLTS